MKPETIVLLIPLLIPVIAIVMGIGIGMFALYLNYRKRKDIYALYHQERMAAIDKGMEVPPLPGAFFGEETEAPDPHGDLRTALILLFISAGAFVALMMSGLAAFRWYALIPGGIGLAFLIFYLAVGMKEARRIEAERAAQAAGNRKSQIQAMATEP